MSWEQEIEGIREVLEECIRLGLVEIVGINQDGEWLYGATEKGKKVVEMDDFGTTINSLFDQSEEED